MTGQTNRAGRERKTAKMRTDDDPYSAILGELGKDRPDLKVQARILMQQQDETFRAICEDFHEAATLCRQLAQSGDTGRARAKVFQELAHELMAEAVAYLERHRSTDNHQEGERQ